MSKKSRVDDAAAPPAVEPAPNGDIDLKMPAELKTPSPPTPPVGHKALVDFEIVGVAGTSTPGTASSSTFSASPVINGGREFVSFSSAALKNRVNDLSFSMEAQEKNPITASVPSLPSSRNTSYTDPIDLLSSDEESGRFDMNSPAFSSIRAGTRLANRNQLYLYRFATPYIITVHMGRNGPHSDEKVYDREFMTTMFDSIRHRERLPNGFKNLTLLCNILKVHSVKMMRKEGMANVPKTTIYANGGQGYHNVLVRLLTRDEILNGEGSDEKLIKWMEQIRRAYLEIKTRYELRLELGGILGRSGSTRRSLDHMLLDSDVADYAKLIYHKQYMAGTLIDDDSKVRKFFAITNAKAAKDLLG